MSSQQTLEAICACQKGIPLYLSYVEEEISGMFMLKGKKDKEKLQKGNRKNGSLRQISVCVNCRVANSKCSYNIAII